MRVKGLFWILKFLLLAILVVLTYFVFKEENSILFFIVEGGILLTAVYLLVFYNRIIKPLKIIGDGMDLLREQDFSSRLRKVGQRDADRIVDVFNKMMEQLKNERLYLREQNHFLDLVINASPMGVVILDLDDKILSINPSACRLFDLPVNSPVEGKELTSIDSMLVEEILKIPLFDSRTIRLSDANIYKCTHSSFVDKGYHHPFYLIESLTEEVFKAEKKAYEKVIRMIAHEVNNTTAGITSTLDTLDETLRGMEGYEDLGEVLQVLIERCYGMSRFISNFADVVRIPVPQVQTVRLNTVVENGKRFMESICTERNIRLITVMTGDDPEVSLDVTLFEQVLVNIIKNAAESIEKDGVSQSLLTRNHSVLKSRIPVKGSVKKRK